MTNATTTTFKEPFLTKIKKALETAYSIDWEGCHKIYVLMDKNTHVEMLDYGYEPVLVKDKDEALKRLYEWFNLSCGLKFITGVSAKDGTGSEYTDLIAQFEYEEYEEDEEDEDG